MKLLSILILLLTSCRNHIGFIPIPNPSPPKTNIVDYIESFDDAVVRARATIQVTGDDANIVYNAIQNLFMGTAYAANATITVTYTNTASVTFALNTASFAPTTIDGNDVLDMGSITVTALKDNNLKVCNPGGNTKCTNAFIRMYTTGEITPSSGESVAGFIHTTDLYGATVWADKAAAPSQVVGKGAINASVVQSYTVPSNVNKIRLTNFPTPTYNVDSDFSNAGSGNYSMVFVVEYALNIP